MARQKRRSNSRNRKTQKINLTVNRLGGNGDGLAGDIVVPFTLPGETVAASLHGKEALSLHRENDSPSRVAPVCQHFGLPGDGCGGCHLQHLGKEGSLAWKVERLTRALHRTLDDLPAIEVIQTSEQSRRRAKLHMKRVGSKWQIGFKRRRSHDVVDLQMCTILDPALFKLVARLRESGNALLPERVREAEVFMTLTNSGVEMVFNGVDETSLTIDHRESMARFADIHHLARISIEDIPVASPSTPTLHFGSLQVDFPASAFLQATSEGEAAMVARVLKSVDGAGAVADLFCGAGTFAGPIASHSRVLAIDSYAPSVHALERAAKLAKLPVRSAVRNLFDDPLTPYELNEFDAVVIDPPRAGASAQFRALAESQVNKVVAVSCNPDTLARDAGYLSSAFGLQSVLLVDQFLYSPHIEAIAVFERS